MLPLPPLTAALPPAEDEPAPFGALSAMNALCRYAPAGARAMFAPDAMATACPFIVAAPFKILSPKANPKGFNRSFNAGTFAPPVTGVQCECVLSSKNRMPVTKTQRVSLTARTYENRNRNRNKLKTHPPSASRCTSRRRRRRRGPRSPRRLSTS